MGLILCFPALLGVCLGIRKWTGLPAGAAPLAGLAGIYLMLFMGGIAGILPAAAWAVVVIGWLVLAAELYHSVRTGDKTLWQKAVTPGSVLFWGGALLLVLRLAFLQPSFLNFDEYSFWGAATQLTSTQGALYPSCETGRPWVMTELPGIPLMGYFFHLVGDFAPWKAILAVDLLLLASLAAVVSCCESKSPRLWGPVALAAILLPTALTIPGRTGLVSTTWLEILGDLPAGILFGGTVAFWLAVRNSSNKARWMVLPVLFLAAGIKSNTLPLALTAAGLIFLDVVCFPPESSCRGARAMLGRAGFGLAGLVMPVAEYLLWSRYTLPFVLANAAGGGMGDTANATLSEVVINGSKMLLGGTGTAFFEQRREDLFAYAQVMAQAFTQRDVSIFGSGAAVCVVIGLVFVLALLTAPNLRQRLRVLVMAMGSTVCFGGYWLMLLLSYAFLFKDSSPSLAGLVSYARYMDSYYAGWLLLALAMLAHQATKAKSWKGYMFGLLTAAVLTVFTLTTWQPQFTILGVSRHVYAADAARTAQAQEIRAELSPEDRVFLIRQGDDGFYWFWYAQALMPSIVEYGAGGGTYGIPEMDDGSSYYQSYTPEEMDALIRENGTNRVLIVENDEIFTESYAPLFTDGLAAAQQGAALYEVCPDCYRPVWAQTEKGAVE